MLFEKKEDLELNQFQAMLKAAGLWFYSVSQRSKMAQKFIAHSYSFFNIMAQLAVLVVGFKDFYLEISVGSFMLDMMYINIELALFLKNIDTLNHFITTMKGILKKRNHDWEREIFDGFSFKAWKLIKFNFSTSITFLLCMVFLPFVYDLYLAAFTDSLEPFFMVNVYICYLPLVRKRDFPYYAATFSSTYIAITGALYFFVLMSILPATVAYMCAELRIIGKRLEKWSEDKENPNRILFLNQIIFEHNEILALIQIMKKYLGLLLLPQNIASSLSITLSLYSLTQALKIRDIDLIIRMCYITLCMTAMIFINCYCAQGLWDESIRLSNVIYMIPWYEESPQVRRSLLMMMVATHKPIFIHYKGLLNMNLHMFGEVIQSSYSFFTILQSTI